MDINIMPRTHRLLFLRTHAHKNYFFSLIIAGSQPTDNCMRIGKYMQRSKKNIYTLTGFVVHRNESGHNSDYNKKKKYKKTLLNLNRK